MGIEWPGAVVITFTAIAFVIMAADWAGPDLVFSVLLAFFVAFGTDPVTTSTKSISTSGCTVNHDNITYSQCKSVTTKTTTQVPVMISLSQAAAGYGNTGLLTVVFLYLVAEGVYQTGGLEYVMMFILGRSRSPFWALIRMMIPTMALSAFLNNTPVVSLLVPILISWSRRSGVPVKKLLIPLSVAAVLGGTTTLIGTSTNLVVSGQLQTQLSKTTDEEVRKQLTFFIFDIAPYGITYAIWGFLFIVLSQRWLLPTDSSKKLSGLRVALRVGASSPVAGKTVSESGLARLQDLNLLNVLKNDVFDDITPDTVLEEGDIIYFGGQWNQVEFVAEEYGLSLVNHEGEKGLSGGDLELATFTKRGSAPYSKLVQLKIALDSKLIGSKIGELKFRDRFRSVVVAVERNDHTANSRIADVVLVANAILLVDAGKDFDEARRLDLLENGFSQAVAVKDGEAKDFIISTRAVKSLSSGIIGNTISSAGLRGVPGLFVLGIDCAENGEHLEHVPREYRIKEGDIVWFSVNVGAINFLTKIPGLQLVQQEQVDKADINVLYNTLIQAVVSNKGQLVGRSLKEVRFRRKYNAAVVAVHREEVRVPLRVQEVILQPGDVLLISAGSEFSSAHKNDPNFTLLMDVPNSNPPKKKMVIVAVLAGVGMVLSQVIAGIREEEYINLWPCAVLTAGVMLVTGCMSGNNARKSILWDVYLTISAAFGISQAMQNTGVAKAFAQVFIKIGEKVGGEGAPLTSIYVATALLSEILTNNAAAAIMYPIAFAAAKALELNFRKMAVAIMLGASAGFINPWSYQCNFMVFVAGNYRLKEFAIFGAFLQIFLFFTAAIILFTMDHWHTVWIISFSVAFVVIFVPLVWSYAVPPHISLPIEQKLENALVGVESFFKILFRPVGYVLDKVSLLFRGGKGESDDDDAKFSMGATADAAMPGMAMGAATK